MNGLGSGTPPSRRSSLARKPRSIAAACADDRPRRQIGQQVLEHGLGAAGIVEVAVEDPVDDRALPDAAGTGTANPDLAGAGEHDPVAADQHQPAAMM